MNTLTYQPSISYIGKPKINGGLCMTVNGEPVRLPMITTTLTLTEVAAIAMLGAFFASFAAQNEEDVVRFGGMISQNGETVLNLMERLHSEVEKAELVNATALESAIEIPVGW